MVFEALENEVIELQPLNEDDFDALFHIASDKTIWANHPDATRYQLEGFTAYFNKLLESNLPYLIIDKSNDEIIGATCYYDYKISSNSVAIGFTFLSTSYWGTDVNRSIKKMMLDHAFLYVDKVIFHVHESNFRSQAALAKIGAVKEREYSSPVRPESLHFEFAIYKPQIV